MDDAQIDRALRLIARDQAAYVRCIDDDRLEAWPDFFAENGVYMVTTAENVRAGLDAGLIYADSRGMLRDRVSALRDANIYERHTYRHMLGQPNFVEERMGDAYCETPFMVARIMRDGATDLFATGRYLDLYRIDVRATLLERTVVCDSSRIDTLLAIPL
jgi:anthranilate 1,2-dioxygenase small subunit